MKQIDFYSQKSENYPSLVKLIFRVLEIDF